MPHATEAVTNGDKNSSQFLTHLTSYPAVNDGITTFKSNPYGRKSLELADGAYSRFGKPVEPYLETPYSYAKPYVQKADELADSGLNTVDSHFPIVKEDTHTIVETAKGYVWWPYNYLTKTWQDEYTKTARHNGRGPGVTTSVLALVSTELRIASDFFQTVADVLGPTYNEGKQRGARLVQEIEDKAHDYARLGQQKADEAQKTGQQKLDEAKQQGDDAAQQAQKKAGDVKDQASKKAEDVKEQAKGAKDEVQKKAQK